MTLEASTVPVPVTALSILQRDGTEIDGLLRQVDPLAGARSVAAAVTAPMWAATLRKVGHQAAGFLHIDIGDVMVAGWVKYRALIEAGRRTRDTTEETKVDLAGRDLVLRQHPRVDVTWEGRTVASIPFEVIVDIRVHSVEALVRGGSLVSLSSGRCDVGVSLETHGVTFSPPSLELDPKLVVDLGEGVRLVD